MDIVFLALALAAAAICYLYLNKTYNYWRDQGVQCVPGIFPGFGHMWRLIFQRINYSEFIRRIYDRYPGRSMVGIYNKTTPLLIVREPELIKTIMQTDFTSFSKNLLILDTRLNPLLALNPFFSYGDTWHVGRKRMVNAFSNKKLKLLYGHVEQVCEKLSGFLDRRLTKDNGVTELELRDLVSRYNGEVAANAGFSVEGRCFEDEPDSTSFYSMGKSMFESTFGNVMKEILNFSLWELNFILRLSYVPMKLDRFIRDVVKETLRYRQQEKSRKGDFLQLMWDTQKIEDEKFDENVLAAYVFSFFTNVYDTSNSTISFAAYQLARHPHVQQKLRVEVQDVLARHGNRLTYESLKEMSYLNQVIDESQRFHAPVGAIGKICTEETELRGTDGQRCRVHPGMNIIVPVSGLHMDPNYWPDPDVFDPDRFNAARRTEIKKYTYLPFGEGPRMCVARRMALMQAKAFLATLVRRCSLKVSPKTREPFKMIPGRFLTEVVGGLWVYVERL